MDKPKVVCICGSSRWVKLHHLEQMSETLKGHIVIPLGFYGHADYPTGSRKLTEDCDENNKIKKNIDQLHFRKIDLSDEVLVITVDHYVGNSTQREVDYAIQQGKPVIYKNYTYMFANSA